MKTKKAPQKKRKLPTKRQVEKLLGHSAKDDQQSRRWALERDHRPGLLLPE